MSKTGQISTKEDSKLNNFYVINHYSHDNVKSNSKKEKNERDINNPAIGVEGFHQSHPTNRNK
jgi:hypothetical protein